MLESMAMGVPVICSPSALRGVDAVDGEHVLGAQTPQEYADAIVEVITNPARRAALSAASRERMLARHTWSSSMQRLDGIIERCLQQYSTKTCMETSAEEVFV